MWPNQAVKTGLVQEKLTSVVRSSGVKTSHTTSAPDIVKKGVVGKFFNTRD